MHELSSCRQKSSREIGNERIRILLERQKEQILADVSAEIQKHEFEADSDRRNIQKLNGVIESQREVRLIVLFKETNNFDEITNFFMNNYWNKIGIFVKRI